MMVGPMATKNRNTGIEWVGGLVALPAYVTGEDEPYRPETLFWMGAEGAVLGHAAGKPGELIGLAAESLRSTIERPMFGKPHAPTRVRVASPELAEALRGGHPGLEVVCAPTPEIDAVAAAMRGKMKEDAATEQSYLSREVGPDAVGAFFRAAAALFRAKPWKVVPSDQSLISVTIEQLGVRDAAMSVIGQMGQSHALILFSGIDDFEAYLAAAKACLRGFLGSRRATRRWSMSATSRTNTGSLPFPPRLGGRTCGGSRPGSSGVVDRPPVAGWTWPVLSGEMSTPGRRPSSFATELHSGLPSDARFME